LQKLFCCSAQKTLALSDSHPYLCTATYDKRNSIVASVNASKAKPSPAPKAAPAVKAAAPAIIEKAVVEAAPKAAVAPVITPKPAAAPIAVKSIPAEGTKIMTDTTKKIEETVKATTAQVTETATGMFKDINVRAKAAMEKTTVLAKDVVEFNKLNLEAVVEAGKIAAKGAQTAAQNVADVGRKNIEDTTAMVKSLSSVKAPADFFKIQGDFARTQFDGAVAEMSKSSEFYLKLAGEVFQPISTRYSVAADAVKARMAA
jgi:phasin family protein